MQLAANVDLHRWLRRSRGTRASAMERFKVGEKVPLVISPCVRRHRRRAMQHFLVAAQHAAILEHQADELAAAGACAALQRLAAR